MKLLLDSHTVIWSMDNPAKLSRSAVEAIENESNERLISIGTVWELSIKVQLGKLALSRPFREWMDDALVFLCASLLPMTLDDADELQRLPLHHRDPFDRLLVAQAKTNGLVVVSIAQAFDLYGVPRIW